MWAGQAASGAGIAVLYASFFAAHIRYHLIGTEAAFAAWMKANHARETELWLKIHKKGSGLPTVSNAQALDVALCWGWIDGIRKSFDDESFLQPTRPMSAIGG